MNAFMLPEAEQDLEEAFDYYQSQSLGLGLQFLDEFRRGVDQILAHPNAWQPLDPHIRRYRLHRFPYGLLYRISPAADTITIEAVMHMTRKPNFRLS
jgi:plasmid stabilization system protein ParE